MGWGGSLAVVKGEGSFASGSDGGGGGGHSLAVVTGGGGSFASGSDGGFIRPQSLNTSSLQVGRSGFFLNLLLIIKAVF